MKGFVIFFGKSRKWYQLDYLYTDVHLAHQTPLRSEERIHSVDSHPADCKYINSNGYISDFILVMLTGEIQLHWTGLPEC